MFSLLSYVVFTMYKAPGSSNQPQPCNSDILQSRKLLSTLVWRLKLDAGFSLENASVKEVSLVTMSKIIPS